MHARALTVAVAAAAACVAWLAVPAPPARAASLGGGCGASGDTMGYNIACQATTTTGGAPARPASARHPSAGGGGGGGSALPPYWNCGLYPIAGNPAHMLRVCPTGRIIGANGLRYAPKIPITANTIVPVGGTPGRAGGGAPAVTPRELLARARNELTLPLPSVQTAPPRGSDGLVGLPEWFWVSPAQWHPQSRRVQAGSVWARVTARPSSIKIQPGAGAAGPGETCRGPGTPYDPRLPASAQHSSCSYTYAQSSDGLPGNTYRVAVTVTWTASWQGSGGTGGGLPALARTTIFALPVAEAQALNPGS